MMYSMKFRGQWRCERQSNLINGGAHFYGVNACADGKYLSLGAIEPRFYREFLQRCEIQDAAWESQCNSSGWPALRERMAALMRTRTRDAWCEALDVMSQ